MQEERIVRVVIADNHPPARTAIQRILKTDPAIQVLATASSFSEAVAETVAHRPDVVILDVHIPVESESRKRELCFSGSGILGVSFANDDEAWSLATEFGATVLLYKTKLHMELIPALLRFSAEKVCA